MIEDLQNTREDFASRFLTEAVRFLESQSPSERNTSGIVIAGRAAWFLPDKSLLHELEEIWNNTPRKDHHANRQFSEIVVREPYLSHCKILSQEEFAEYLQELAPERYSLCSNSSLAIEDVLQTAKSPLDIEEIGCTYAVLGKYELALETANQAALEKFRQDTIRWTVEVEKLRRGDFTNPDLSVLGLQNWGAGPWQAGHVALCILGRLPYMGYPYPDW